MLLLRQVFDSIEASILKTCRSYHSTFGIAHYIISELPMLLTQRSSASTSVRKCGRPGQRERAECAARVGVERQAARIYYIRDNFCRQMKYMHLGNGKGCEKQVACGRGGGDGGYIYKDI